MTKHILTKEQRAAGLETTEEEDFLYLIDTSKSPNIRVAAFYAVSVKIPEILRAANDYLITRELS